jgi:hypothetical protein
LQLIVIDAINHHCILKFFTSQIIEKWLILGINQSLFLLINWSNVPSSFIKISSHSTSFVPKVLLQFVIQLALYTLFLSFRLYLEVEMLDSWKLVCFWTLTWRHTRSIIIRRIELSQQFFDLMIFYIKTFTRNPLKWLFKKKSEQSFLFCK